MAEDKQNELLAKSKETIETTNKAVQKEKKPTKKQKHKKKPQHTKLVVPSEKPAIVPLKKDRLGRKITEEKKHASEKNDVHEVEIAPKKAKKSKKQTKQSKIVKDNLQLAQDAEDELPLPNNVILLPVQKKRKRFVRRKRMKRSAQLLILAAVFLSIVLVYTSGVYLTAGVMLGETWESVKIAFSSGAGYPAEVSVPGFIEAEPMGSGGFAIIGDKDLIMMAENGKRIRNVQHSYINPWLTAGNKRLCVYDRGGKNYSVEGRTKTILQGSTEDEIIFAQMSPGGYFALVTASRYSAILQVFDPVMDLTKPEFTFPVSNGKPVSITFHSDNRNFALACLTAGEDGAVGSIIYLLQTNRSVERAIIEVNAAIPLEMKFLSANRLLVLFDEHIALYDGNGVEFARYNFDGRSLLTANINEHGGALVFGSESQENISLVILDEALKQQGKASLASAPRPRVLLVQEGAFVLVGQEVFAYSRTGYLTDSLHINEKTNDLVFGGEALLITAKNIQPLAYMLEDAKIESSEASLSLSLQRSEPIEEKLQSSSVPELEESSSSAQEALQS